MGSFSGMTQSSSSTIAFAVGAVAATTLWWQFSSRPSTKGLHVSYKKPQFPLAIRIIATLPASMRRSMVLQGAAPKPPLDACDLELDVNDNNSPFIEKKELVPNKLWRVRYQFAGNVEMLSMAKMMFGMDLLDEEFIVPQASSPAEQEQLKQVIAKLRTLVEACQSIKDARIKAQKCFEAGFVESQDMLVVKLNENSLLLYNPCRMHEEIVQYLKTIGSVDYLVSGSGSHTNQLPQAATAFPSAKIICSQVASIKCQSVGMKPADYEYTDAKVVESLNSMLGPDVQLFHVQGDIFTQCMLIQAHGHLLDVDLSCYGGGNRHFNVPDSLWADREDTSLSSGKARLLFYSSMAKATVAPGYLPDFRVLGCDPSSIFHKLTLEEPTESSCQEMAASLRKLLASGEYEFVDNVHSVHQESVPAEEFKKVVNASWSWLDGQSLLP